MGGEEEQWGAAVQPIYFLKNAVFVGRTSRLNPFRKGHLGDSGARQQRRQTMPQFHETLRGKKFFEADLARLIKALERVADQIEQANQSSSDTQIDPSGKEKSDEY